MQKVKRKLAESQEEAFCDTNRKGPRNPSEGLFLFSAVQELLVERLGNVNSAGNSADVNIDKEKLSKALEKCGLPLTIRGEALTLEQFAKLSNLLVQQ